MFFQELRQQLVDRDEQLDALRKANSVYTLQKVPDLRNQIKSRDELLKDLTQSSTDRDTDLVGFVPCTQLSLVLFTIEEV